MPLSRNFTPTCTTHTHTHSLRISPSMRVLPRSPVSFFHSCSSTIVPALNRCAVSPSLKRLASRNNTVRVRLVSHHSPDTFSVSRVPSLAPGVPLLGLSVLTSARHTIPKPAHELTHSLTYLLTLRAVCFFMVTVAHVAPSASHRRLLLHRGRPDAEAR